MHRIDREAGTSRVRLFGRTLTLRIHELAVLAVLVILLTVLTRDWFMLDMILLSGLFVLSLLTSTDSDVDTYQCPNCGHRLISDGHHDSAPMHRNDAL